MRNKLIRIKSTIGGIMIYTELTKKAINICFEAHKEQKDLGKMPYVHHPFHLAEQMRTEKEICLALLHDVVEDTPWTLKDLEEQGFPADVVEAVGLMTHAKEIPYLDYVEGLRSNPLASAVKLADLRHNSTAGRLKRFTEKDAARLRKYLRAQAILTGGVADTDNMCLRVRHTLREQKKESTVLEIVYEPDGRVRCYLLRTVNAPESEKTGIRPETAGQEGHKTESAASGQEGYETGSASSGQEGYETESASAGQEGHKTESAAPGMEEGTGRQDVEERSFPDFSSLLVHLAGRGFSVTEMNRLFRMNP